MSRSPALAHPVGAVRSRSLLLAVVVALSACVEQTTVIGDGRSMQACSDAPVIEAPPAGCTTLTVQSRGPYGCALRSEDGAQIDELPGSWFRLRSAPGREATLRVRTVGDSRYCASDAGALEECASSLSLTTTDDAPCTCSTRSLVRDAFTGVSSEIALVSTEQEVLLAPVGQLFEVSVCTR